MFHTLDVFHLKDLQRSQGANKNDNTWLGGTHQRPPSVAAWYELRCASWRWSGENVAAQLPSPSTPFAFYLWFLVHGPPSLGWPTWAYSRGQSGWSLSPWWISLHLPLDSLFMNHTMLPFWNFFEEKKTILNACKNDNHQHYSCQCDKCISPRNHGGCGRCEHASDDLWEDLMHRAALSFSHAPARGLGWGQQSPKLGMRIEDGVRRRLRVSGGSPVTQMINLKTLRNCRACMLLNMKNWWCSLVYLMPHSLSS